jgi:peptidoglycan-associated lipoprotein
MEEDMLRKVLIFISLLIVVPGLLFTTSCAKKTVHTAQNVEATAPAMEENAGGQTPAVKAEKQTEENLNTDQPAEQAAKVEEVQEAKMASQIFINDDIYFDFDSAVLRDTARESLIQKAEWIRMNPEASVIIEGHCDQRGTGAYNIALGDRRAQSAKDFFVDLGIDPKQLSTISYGEERPVDTAQNEDAWSKNRRAHFVVE